MEQRRFQRVNFLQKVGVIVNGESFQTHCLDISLKGALLVRPNDVNWQANEKAEIVIDLTPEEQIRMNCTIMHMDEDVVGCLCDSLDIESLTSLRRLLELNLANPQEVNRELGDLLK